MIENPVIIFKNMNAHGGFTPATPAPMDAIPPEQVIRHHRTDFKGGKRVTGTVPSFILPVFLSHPLIKEFYRAPFLKSKKK
jgi:hypothetical protein